MIALRPVASDADLEMWARIKSTVVPNEPVTPQQLVDADEPDRLLLLASLDGIDAGCGVGAPSSFGGRAYCAASVLTAHRRRGVGTALFRALADHGRAIGREGVNAFVDAGDDGSIAFARSFGLEEADHQLEQLRRVSPGEQAPLPPPGVELVSLSGRREELLREAWESVALEGYDDLPMPGPVTHSLETWLREEATRPDGSFVAIEDGVVVGYAGLLVHANGPASAEHGLTAVRRDRRRRGIARALKQAQLHWASRSGVLELVTWTQRGNEAMQALNRGLGYRDVSKLLTMHGPLPALDGRPAPPLR
ncbi:MAG TPA: GNAT family N-acetyltransferase [Gaiellaceae bacterium]|jgi:GNAT superfamily N-acetyltransferase